MSAKSNLTIREALARAEPVSFPPALQEVEARFIQTRRRVAATGENAAGFPSAPVGLALSGGGIRSATFNLGVLQALAKARLLRVPDYLSTVSGGGYVCGVLGLFFQ